MEPEDLSTGKIPHVAHLLLWVALLGSLYFGISMSLGMTDASAINLGFGIEVAIPKELLLSLGSNVTTGILPFLILLLVSCLMI